MTVFTDDDYLAAFRMPSIDTITGRSSTINAAFTKALIPVTVPNANEVKTVLNMLGMTPDDVRCAYCGDPATEWDHFRATVRDKMPTGYGSHIRNLVPACGKCNQSRGNKDWRGWMTGTNTKAKLSPAHRGVPDLDAKVVRLAEYEAWSEHDPVNLAEVAGPDLWNEYQEQRQAVHAAMRRAQELAVQIRQRMAAKASED